MKKCYKLKNIKIKKKNFLSFFIYFIYLKLNLLIRLFFKRNLKYHKKILIFRTGNLGDIAATIPLFYEIRKRFKDSKIYLLTSRGKKYLPGASDFIENQGYFDEIIEYYPDDKISIREMEKRIKELKPDALFYIPQEQDSLIKHFKVFLWGKIMGIKNIYGGMINFIPLFIKEQNKNLEFIPEAERLMILINEKIKDEEYYKIDENVMRRIKEIIKKLRIKDFILVHPGAKRKTNKWDEERFIGIINQIKNKFDVILTGSKDEKEICKMIREETGCIDLSGELNIKELIALLSFSRLLISNDTGPIHLAPLVKIPVVVIQSARDFENKWKPFGENVYLIRKNTGCTPCLKEECENLICMDISVEEVLKVVEKII